MKVAPIKEYWELSKHAAVQIGGYIIGASYSEKPGKIGIYRIDGEGGDFLEKEFEKVVEKFYKENF